VTPLPGVLDRIAGSGVADLYRIVPPG
jgi:hypothetical protein